MSISELLGRSSRFFTRLRKNVRGVALTEFAVVAPVFITLGMFGFEIAYMAVTKMKVSQVALSVADNASRLGQTDNSAVPPTITEDDVEAVLKGGERQGQSIDIGANGRIVLTSLEYDPVTDRQFIHWQRCVGEKDVQSAYGNESDKNGLTGTELQGMGNGASKVTAPAGEAVMFVEIFYDYPAVFSSAFVPQAEFREEAAFIIRDDRTLQEPNEKGLSGSKDNGCEPS